MSDMLAMQDSLLSASAKELLRTDLLHLSSMEQAKHTEYEPNSYVLVHYRTGAPPTWLHIFGRGPIQVVSRKDSRYLLKDLISLKEKEYHVSDMKPFIFDPSTTNPTDIARRDHGILCQQSLRTSRRFEIQERSGVSCQMVGL